MKRILLTFSISFLIFPFTGAAQGEQRYASGTATDQENNSFEWINYGTQDWTIENAKVETYRDGTEIPQVTDASVWANLTTGAWCYYDNDPTKGKLYNWYAVAGIHDSDPNTPNKEFAPEGWHVPSDAEWIILENYLIANGYNYDGTTTGNKIAKSMSSNDSWTNWTADGAIGNDLTLNNLSGFKALPFGSILNNVFSGFGSEARFWTSTYFGSNRLWHKRFDYRFAHIYSHNEGATHAASVRFVRDSQSEGDIQLNGTVSVENNQVKNVADPTDNQDVATKNYVDSNVNSFSGSYSDLTDTPTSSLAFQLPMLTTAQRDEIVASSGMMIYNVDVNEYQGFQNYEKQLPAEIDQQHLTINNGGGENRAQSFTSSATGELTLVKLPLSVMMESISLSFKIIEGEGVNGTVLFETSYNLTNSNQEWIEFGISGVDVISGNLYTIQLTEENSGCGMPPCYTWGMDTSGNNYSGGQFFYNGTPYSNGEYDSAFITYVSSEELVNEWITLH